MEDQADIALHQKSKLENLITLLLLQEETVAKK